MPTVSGRDELTMVVAQVRHVVLLGHPDLDVAGHGRVREDVDDAAAHSDFLAFPGKGHVWLPVWKATRQVRDSAFAVKIKPDTQAATTLPVQEKTLSNQCHTVLPR